MTNNDYKNWNVGDWEAAPIDRVCDLLREHPQLIASCPDSVWRKFGLGHWAKLIREPSKNSNGFVIVSNEGRLAVVDKMKELGKATEAAVADEKAVLIGGFEWCCPIHWANEYGSVYIRHAAAVPMEEKVKRVADCSAMNPHGDINGRYHADIPKHIQWLAALAADFAAMSAEAAVSAPEYAEEYSIIAQAAAYEAGILSPKQS